MISPFYYLLKQLSTSLSVASSGNEFHSIPPLYEKDPL